MSKHEPTSGPHWLEPADDQPLPPTGVALVSLSRWQRDRDTLTGWAQQVQGRRLGLRLEVDTEIAALGSLEPVTLIVVDVRSFTDGRAFSLARVLREKLGYRWELRARGDLLPDQQSFLARCGYDAVDSVHHSDEDSLRGDFTSYYQSSGPLTRDTNFIRAARRARGDRLS